MSHKPVLYIGEKNVSSWSMRAWVALRHKGVDFEERTISLLADQDRSLRRRVSWTGKVPVLHHDGLAIPDSLAIFEYAEDTWPAPGHAALWPSDRRERAQARSLAAIMHSGFPRLRESMSFNLCFLPRRPTPTPGALVEAQEMLAAFETALAAKTSPGPFLFGAFCGADAAFAPAVFRLTSFGVSTAATPLARAYASALLDYPAVKEWLDAARLLAPVENE
jgi:glutathione S-transferase